MLHRIAPYNIDELEGKFWAGDNGFSQIAVACPGLETRMPITFSEGVVKEGLICKHLLPLHQQMRRVYLDYI